MGLTLQLQCPGFPGKIWLTPTGPRPTRSPMTPPTPASTCVWTTSRASPENGETRLALSLEPQSTFVRRNRFDFNQSFQIQIQRIIHKKNKKKKKKLFWGTKKKKKKKKKK